MQPNALATSFRGGQPGAGLKVHFLTRKGDAKAMVRIAGSSFFLDVSELHRLVMLMSQQILMRGVSSLITAIAWLKDDLQKSAHDVYIASEIKQLEDVLAVLRTLFIEK